MGAVGDYIFYLVDLVHPIAGKLEHQLPGHDGRRHDAADGGRWGERVGGGQGERGWSDPSGRGGWGWVRLRPFETGQRQGRPRGTEGF